MLVSLNGVPAITEDGARLDIHVAANSFWGSCFDYAYSDVMGFNPHVLFNCQQNLAL